MIWYAQVLRLDAVCVGAEGDVERIELWLVGKDLARVKEAESCEGVVEHGGWVGVRACVYIHVRLSGPSGVK